MRPHLSLGPGFGRSALSLTVCLFLSLSASPQTTGASMQKIEAEYKDILRMYPYDAGANCNYGILLCARALPLSRVQRGIRPIASRVKPCVNARVCMASRTAHVHTHTHTHTHTRSCQLRALMYHAHYLQASTCIQSKATHRLQHYIIRGSFCVRVCLSVCV